MPPTALEPRQRLSTHPEEPSEGSSYLRSLYLEVPDVNAADDPDHRLRIVRTPTESIFEATKEDERRRVGKRKRRYTLKKWGNSKLSRGFSSNSIAVGRPGTASSSIGQGLKQVESGLGEFGNQVEQANTRTANQEEEAKAEQFHSPAEEGLDTGNTDQKAAEGRRRRNVYVNVELPMTELDKYGEPRVYARNKVRTSKYTIWTFFPKNLTEQFRRVANLYFLGLVVLQSKSGGLQRDVRAYASHEVFPIFGGASPILAMLPLLAILCITAVKDGIEDFRRQQLDEAVNNSAVTRLGDWRNVNLARYKRSLSARLFGLSGRSASVNKLAKVSKGVRKLREKEGDFNADFLYEGGSQESNGDFMASAASLPNAGHHINGLSYSSDPNSREVLEEDEAQDAPNIGSDAPVLTRPSRSRGISFSKSLATSHRTMQRQGVVDYDRATPGTAKWERTLWKKLEVGDVVLLREDDQVPADIVVLSTSDSDGVCFVETKNVRYLADHERRHI